MNYYAASGNVPAIPSVILTASQITYFQSTIADINNIKQRITGVSYTAGTTTTDISGNLSVSERITRPTYTAPVANNEYTMKQYTDTQDTYYYGLNQTAINDANSNINAINNTLTGISYNAGTDTTTIDNNVVISNGKNLNIYRTQTGTMVAQGIVTGKQIGRAHV